MVQDRQRDHSRAASARDNRFVHTLPLAHADGPALLLEALVRLSSGRGRAPGQVADRPPLLCGPYVRVALEHLPVQLQDDGRALRDATFTYIYESCQFGCRVYRVHRLLRSIGPRADWAGVGSHDMWAQCEPTRCGASLSTSTLSALSIRAWPSGRARQSIG